MDSTAFKYSQQLKELLKMEKEKPVDLNCMIKAMDELALMEQRENSLRKLRTKCSLSRNKRTE